MILLPPMWPYGARFDRSGIIDSVADHVRQVPQMLCVCDCNDVPDSVLQ